MTTWGEFGTREPLLAARGSSLLGEAHGYCFLATVAADASPRVNAVAPIRTSTDLCVAVLTHSPKCRDLVREPRIALHSSVVAPEDEEFVVHGHVIAATPADVQHAGNGATVHAGMTVFEVLLTEARWTRWIDQKPTHRRWSAAPAA